MEKKISLGVEATECEVARRPQLLSTCSYLQVSTLESSLLPISLCAHLLPLNLKHGMVILPSSSLSYKLRDDRERERGTPIPIAAQEHVKDPAEPTTNITQ